MPTTILIKRSSTAGDAPATGDVSVGELAVNTADRILYTKHSDGTVVEIGGGATGGFNNKVFYENETNVTASYEITTGFNAMSAGPITIDSGVTVTVTSGSVWTIV